MPKWYSSSPYTSAGGTISEKNAMAQYGLTIEDLHGAKIPVQSRSCHGNRYFLYVTSDVIALQQKKLREDPQFQVTILQKDLKDIRSKAKTLQKQLKEMEEKEQRTIEKIIQLGGTPEEAKPPRKPPAKAKMSARKSTTTTATTTTTTTTKTMKTANKKRKILDEIEVESDDSD